MSAGRWERLSTWHNAWLAGDGAERSRLRAQLRNEQPDLVAEAEDLIAGNAPVPGFLETPAFILAAQDAAREATELPAGTSVGPYRIAGLLARGGMGDVYRATDTRLHRDVALKAMAHGLAAESQQVDRFLLEARVTAALDHPNIVKLYDVGIVDGRPYFVAELLEGETLRARLARGPIAVNDVVRISIEVARGLVAAHAAGLVHRDMKPENIFLTRSGATRILDFGVAKLVRQDPAVGGTATLPGVLLGTAGYLAPEQTTGQTVDLRADLFSLGTIMFEMLTGERAFARDHTIDTLYAIRHDPTPDVRQRREDVPPALAEIVSRLLEKAPEARFQSSADLLWALEHVATGALGESGAAAGRRAVVSREAAPRTRARTWRAVAIACALAATLALAAFAAWRPASPAPPAFERLTFRLGIVENARFVPGSEDIAYSAAWAGDSLRVYTTRSGALDSRPVLDTTAVLRDVAVDGRLLLGVGDEVDLTTLAVTPPTGRGQRELENHIEEAVWAEGGTMALLRVVDGQSAIEYPPRQVLYQTPGVVRSMRVSPDGQSIGFIEHPGPGSSSGKVVMVARGGTPRVLSDDWGDLTGLAWSPDGRELLFAGARAGAGASVHAVAVDGRLRVVLSAPGDLALLDVAADGRLLISRDNPRASVWVLRENDHPDDLSWFDWGGLGDLSADGRFLLINEFGTGGGVGGALFIRPTNGDAAVRLGTGQGVDISPDGKFVTVVDAGKLKLIPTGAGQPTELPNPNGFIYRDSQWFPDGKRVSEGVAAPPGKRGMYVRDLAIQTERFITADISTRPAISPTGDSAAFRDLTGNLVVHSLTSGKRQTVAAERGDQVLGWSDDGTSLFARSLGDQRSIARDGRSANVCRGGRLPVEIVKIDVHEPRRQVLRTMDSRASASSCLGVMRISGDGRTIAYQTSEILSDLYLVRGAR